MSKAVAGASYTIVSGDTLSGIAKQAYGRAALWRIIWQANQTTLRSGNPDLIFSGEVVNIPGDPLKENVTTEGATLANKELDELTIDINGFEIPVMSARLTKAIDTISDGWTAVISYDANDTLLRDAIRPFSFQEAKLYLGGKLMITGFLYKTEVIIEQDGVTASLEGWSKTVDLVDSNIKPPYEQRKITLEDRANKLVEPFNIKVTYDALEDSEFNKVTSDPTDTIHGHLTSLASQRGILITSNAAGELVFFNPNTDGEPVATIEEGQRPALELRSTFNSRNRFNAYKALGKSPRSPSKNKTAKDNVVPAARFNTFRADETTAGNLQKAADWKRSKTVAESISIKVPVNSWYYETGKLWEENQLVTLVSNTMFMPDGFTFLIKEIEYTYDTSGTKAILTLVPPEVYTGESVDEPWLEAF